MLEQKKEVLEGLERLEPREAEPAEAELEAKAAADEEMPDDRLRLIFTCCHPALAPEARIALTLRLLGGLTTAEIASAFLASEAAMAKRLVRAKRKIRDAGIPYEVPGPEQLPDRMPSVLSTLYLIFNEGYYASRAGPLLRTDLAEEAIRLARVLAQILPADPEARALLALLLIQHSRRAARVDAAGEMVLLADQDRSLWDRAQIDEARRISETLGPAATGPYALQAAIATEHARADRAEDTDWGRIGRLYGRLSQVQPSPVVELNRAVAVAMDEGPEAGLELIDAIVGLDAYQPFHTSRADLLRRAGRAAEAEISYRRALELTENPVQRAFIERRIAEVAGDRR